MQDGRDIQRDAGATFLRTPLPKFQLFITYLSLFAEPITATVIYPFAPQFVRATGITGGDEKKTGYYAGVVESIFFLTECLTVYFWARASDSVGRRPVLLIGPLGLSLAMIGFGLSKTFWSLVIFRGLQGVFNGNIGVGKTVIAELSDATNMAYAFSFVPVIWNSGVIFGPLIGGIFAVPDKGFPNTFGRLRLFRDFPYLLPCLIAGGVSFFSFAFGFVGLKETWPRKVKDDRLAQHGDNTNYGSISSPLSETEDESKPLSLNQILTPRFQCTLLNYGLLAFSEMTLGALIPLMFSTSIGSGGLGLSSARIGLILGIRGVMGSMLPIFVFAPMIQKHGPRKMYIASMCCVATAIMLFPALSFLVKLRGKADAVVWLVMVVQACLGCMLSTGYASMQVLIIDNSTTKASLASINSIAQMTGCAIRALAPTVSSSLFALSMENNILGGYVVYLVLAGILLVTIRSSFLLPKNLQKLRYS